MRVLVAVVLVALWGLPLVGAESPELQMRRLGDSGLEARCPDDRYPVCDDEKELRLESSAEPRIELRANPDAHASSAAAEAVPSGPAAPWVAAVLREPATWASATLALLGLFLYHRFRAARALDHPVRARLLAQARAQPGLVAADFARSEGLTLNAVLYHVRVLVREGHLSIRRVGRAGLLFPREVPPDDREKRAALRPPLARALLEFARTNTNASSLQAATVLRVSPRSVRAHLCRLTRHGLVVRRRTAQGAFFALTVNGERFLGPGPSAVPLQAAPFVTARLA